MSTVDLERRRNVAVICVDNPPVNAISHAVRDGVVKALADADADPAVEAIVLAARGRTFMAGADITEFGKPPQPPLLPDVVDALEAPGKPVVAAIHGTALGGGLEMALGCHYRIAAPDAKLGLPEVNLGIIPGAQGTQRLPRLAGVPKALEMIVSGKPVPAKEAQAAGIVDELAEGDLLEDAVAYAGRLAAGNAPLRRISAMDAPVEGSDAAAFAAFREKNARALRNLTAPERAIQAVEAAVKLSFAEGRKRERALIEACFADPQSGALRHAFFAERQTARVPGLPKDADTRAVESVGIVGGGTMGRGIALAFAAAGFPVTIAEQTGEAADAARKAIAATLDKGVAKGKITPEARDAQLGRLGVVTHLSALSQADLIVEAVFEDMKVKKDVFTRLDGIAKDRAILATNTSYLDVNEIAAATARPGDVIGLHFFSPANIMKLLEIVRAEKTADDVLATALKLAKAIGKTPVVAGVCRGFIGNRMLQGYQREAGLLLLEGATPEQVDRAMTGFGYAMGPFQVSDLAGIDIGYLLRKGSDPSTYDPQAFRVHDRLVEQGRKGQKTGAGFYSYTDGTAQPDPAVLDIIAEEAEKAGFERREIGDGEIVERCVLPLINEGAAILEEGIAIRSADIDVVYLYGYGFPRWRGGPMYYVDSLGLDHVLARIEACRARHGDRWWTPQGLLQRLAGEGKSFAAYDRGEG